MGSSDEVYSESSTSTPNTSVGWSRSPSPELIHDKCSFLTNRTYGFDGGSANIEGHPRSAIPCVRNICCVGAGYVGGPTAAVIAFQNPLIEVTVVDLDADRIQKWNSRHLPVAEPGLLDVVRVARDGTRETSVHGKGEEGTNVTLAARRKNLTFSTNVPDCVAAADMIFLSVNTPTKKSGIGAGAATNLVALESAMTSIAKNAKPGAIIVEKSTVPCGTARTIREILTLYRPAVPFEILSNPEFLAEGTAVKDLLFPDRILIGSSRTQSGLDAAKALKAVYSTWVEPSKILAVNLWSSELAKLVANAMLAQRISSINAISAICDETGADIDEIAKAVGLDKRLGQKFLKAGLGFGGSCFKKDILNLVYLARSLHLPEVADYWLSVLSINEFQRERFVNKVVSKLHGALMGKKLAILGYAFKQDTNDTRESPAIEVIKTLLAEHPAEIAIFDPGCRPSDINKEVDRFVYSGTTSPLKPCGPVEAYSNSHDACMNASAILIMTSWDQFRYPAMKPKDSAFTKNRERKGRSSCFELKNDPSEMDIIAFSESNRVETNSGSIPNTFSLEDRLLDQVACPEGCELCKTAQETDRIKAFEPIDWARIAYNMREPRWVFDGRNIVEGKELELLGFRVESMGKASTRPLQAFQV